MATERDGEFADEQLERALTHVALDARDRSLAVELIYGVLRHRATLDWRLAHVSDRPVARLPVKVQMVLRLGAYQILYLQRVPPSAAVNESVQLIKAGRARSPRNWTGFVNAVLRALIRKPAPPWPDQAVDPIASLSVRYSCPAWLTRRWVERCGIVDAEQFCHATSEIPPLTIRANSLVMTRDRLLSRLIQAGHEARTSAVSPVGLHLEKCGSVSNLDSFQEGGFYVEDEAAQLIPLLLDPQPGERVLDACAAPGGKTTHLAALMQNRGEIVAIDRSASRVHMIEDNCRRLGVSIVTAVARDASQLQSVSDGKTDRRGSRDGLQSVRDRLFDRILLDAPCSALGVLRRHPEGKWQKQVTSLARHHNIQSQILDAVSALLRPGGVLVYSTCSTEPEENESVVDQFCRAHTEFWRESVIPWLPPAGLAFLTKDGNFSTMRNQQSMDAFFAARLTKVKR